MTLSMPRSKMKKTWKTTEHYLIKNFNINKQKRIILYFICKVNFSNFSSKIHLSKVSLLF